MSCTLIDPEIIRCLQCLPRSKIEAAITLLYATISNVVIVENPSGGTGGGDLRFLLSVDRTDITADSSEVLVNDTLA